jgi:hypothetical protein
MYGNWLIWKENWKVSSEQTNKAKWRNCLSIKHEFVFQQLNPDDPVQDEKLEKIKHDRNYSYEDQITCSKECLPNYEEKVFVLDKIEWNSRKIIFKNHHHVPFEIVGL